MSSYRADRTFLNRFLRTAAVSGVLFAFDLVYNLFSHGIGSDYMHFAPLVVLASGTIGALIVHLLGSPGWLSVELFRMGLSAIVLSMILQGVMEIAGSEAPALRYFVLVGLFLWAIALTAYLLHRNKDRYPR